MPGRILKEDIEKVRSAADLYDIVSADVTLKASGSGTFVGLCPFHDEKTPSFSVRPSLGTWHCFGCGLGGDIFGYVEQSENIDFAEAVELLADKYHIELHYDATRNERRTGSTRSRLLEVCEKAEQFFASQLMSKEALPARKLLAGRNFMQADCERFGCGYAPRGWDSLVNHLAAQGFTQQEMIDAGLARQGNRGAYDYFRGRVTWPIRDSTGRTVGFGARKLYDDDSIQAKYINTPDTVLYHKNQVLYGIDMAKPAIVKKRQVVIVEGYTDVMACHLAGIDTAVATCGTAFGLEHAKIIRRFISDDSLGAVQLIGPTKGSRVVFTFDGDAAGQKAAIHAFGLDGTFLTQTFVAVARDGLDPCDLRIQQGDAAVRNLIDNATPLYDFVIDAAINSFDTQYTTGQMGAVKAVAPVIAQIRDRSLWGMYARKAAGKIGVDPQMLAQEVRSARRRLNVRDEDAYTPRKNSYSGTVSASVAVASAGSGTDYSQPAYRKALEHENAVKQGYYRIDDSVFITEQQFLAMVIQTPLAINRVMFNRLTDNSFMTPVFRSLFMALSAADGLPSKETPQGLWIHNLTKAAGPMLEQVINELSVMPLPLPPVQNENGRVGSSNTSDRTAAVQLREPTEAEIQYATQLLTRLIDADAMRSIAQLKRRMNSLPEGEEKLAILGKITAIEAQRKELAAGAFGNTFQ